MKTLNTLRLATPLAAMLAAPLAAQDAVVNMGTGASAGMFGVTTEAKTVDAVFAPSTVDELAADLRGGDLPEIAWRAVSTNTDVRLTSLDTLEGDAVGVDVALSEASSRIETIRKAVAAEPTLREALSENGLSPDHVVAAYGSAASTVELVVDTRG